MINLQNCNLPYGNDVTIFSRDCGFRCCRTVNRNRIVPNYHWIWRQSFPAKKIRDCRQNALMHHGSMMSFCARGLSNSTFGMMAFLLF